MGYRHYFYEIPKGTVDQIKDLTNEQLLDWVKSKKPDEVDEDGYFYFSDAFGQKEIHEFGKLYYEDTAQQIYDQGKPLFNNEDTQSCYEDYTPYVVGKEGLLKAIEIYKTKIIDYYKSLLVDGETQIIPLLGLEVPRENPKENKQEKFIKDTIREWEHGYVLNLNENSKKLTGSWRYEYEVFELVRLLKTIDWETTTVLFYGH